jgi:hypothetical protein
MKTKTKLKALLVTELVLTGSIFTHLLMDVVRGSYILAAIDVVLLVGLIYATRNSFEKFESDIETDYFLEGYKRGLKRGHM